MLPDIKQQCAGRWESVLVNIGIEEHVLKGKHGPCLFCGGKDRARWVREKEFYFCNQCGARTPIDMAMDYLAVSFKEAVFEIRKILGVSKVNSVIDINQNHKKNEQRLRRLHAGFKRITKNTPAGMYLKKRGLDVIPESACYAHSSVPYYDNGEKTGVFPAIVSVFTGKDGDTVTYHITYLTDNGDKLDCSSPKKILPTIGEMPGGAIRLFKPGKTLCIAEGIETALAVYQDEGFPVWATANAQMMSAFEPPEEVEKLIIYVDEDKNFTGQKVAYELANKLTTKNKIDVSVVRLITSHDSYESYIDNGINMDYLDYLNVNTISEKAVI